MNLYHNNTLAYKVFSVKNEFCVSVGVVLNRKSTQATGAHENKNLQAQLLFYEPNILHEISIFISIYI